MLRKLQLTYRPSATLQGLATLVALPPSPSAAGGGGLSAGFREALAREFGQHAAALERVALSAQWLEARRLASPTGVSVSRRDPCVPAAPTWLHAAKVTVDLRKLVTHGAGRGPRASRAALSLAALGTLLEELHAGGLWEPVQARLGSGQATLGELLKALAMAVARGGVALPVAPTAALRRELGAEAVSVPRPAVAARVGRVSRTTPESLSEGAAPGTAAFEVPAPEVPSGGRRSPKPKGAVAGGVGPRGAESTALPRVQVTAKVAGTEQASKASKAAGATVNGVAAQGAAVGTEKPSVAGVRGGGARAKGVAEVASAEALAGAGSGVKTKGGRSRSEACAPSERASGARKARGKVAEGAPKVTSTGAFGGLPDDAESEDRRGDTGAQRSARGLTLDAEFFLAQAGVEAWPCAPEALVAARRSTLARLHPDRAGEPSAAAFHRCIKGSEELLAALRKDAASTGEGSARASEPMPARSESAPAGPARSGKDGHAATRTSPGTPMGPRPSAPLRSVHHWP